MDARPVAHYSHICADGSGREYVRGSEDASPSCFVRAQCRSNRQEVDASAL